MIDEETINRKKLIRRLSQHTLLAFLSITIMTSCDIILSEVGIGCDVAELIAAINDANANPDPNTIILEAACIYELADIDNAYDTQGLQSGEDGANGLPVISTEITIEGNNTHIARTGSSPATPEFRIFFVAPGGNLTLNNVYIEMGAVLSANRSNDGGGIYILGGSVTLNQSYVMDNTASGLGGGIYLDNGSLVISNSSFDSNEASSGGAIACQGASVGSGNLSMEGVSFSSNIASGVFPLGGGALYMSDGCSSHITHSQFTLNQAVNGYGGAIYSEASASVSDGTTFEDNTARVAGGIYNDYTGDMHVDTGIIRGNTATSTGIEAIGGGFGGGLFNGGEMTVINSTVDGNTAYLGGGIGNAGTLFLFNSTLSGNSGTGLYVMRYSAVPYTLLRNTTISGNTAGTTPFQFQPGGAYIEGRGSIVHSTIANNSCAANGCGLRVSCHLGIYQIKNSLIAYNGPRDCSFSMCSVVHLERVGENLASDSSCEGFTYPVDPMLGLLSDNGGPTLTHALLPGSPALDIVTDCTIEGDALASDQRGEPRPYPQGGSCDVGSFELQIPDLSPTSTPTPEPPTRHPPTLNPPTPTCPVTRPC